MIGLVVYQFLIMYLCISGNEESVVDLKKEEVIKNLFNSDIK